MSQTPDASIFPTFAALPSGACDAHCHVVGPESDYPFAPGKTGTEAPREALFALHEKLGIERCVVVQSATHGFDNLAIEDTIRAGEGRYLGVAAVSLDIADAELRRMALAGFRGIRFNFMAHLAAHAQPERLVEFSRRLAPLDMHLQVHCASTRLAELIPVLQRTHVPVMIDHMGRVDATLGPEHPHFAALHALLRDERFWVKVSGVDRISPTADLTPGAALARLLVADYPDRCVWGTDWPHPNHHHVPDDAALVAMLSHIAPDEALLHRVLVSNPQHFYRFPT